MTLPGPGLLDFGRLNRKKGPYLQNMNGSPYLRCCKDAMHLLSRRKDRYLPNWRGDLCLLNRRKGIYHLSRSEGALLPNSREGMYLRSRSECLHHRLGMREVDYPPGCNEELIKLRMNAGA